jgi:deoxyhypusine monooxygenase
MLKQVGGVPAVDALAAGLTQQQQQQQPADVKGAAAAADDEKTTAKSDAEASVLLQHEIAYVLGQMQHVHALPVLRRVLRDTAKQYDAIVRHEAAEALGAIGPSPDGSSLRILKEFCSDAQSEVAETCEIAVAKLLCDIEQQKQAQGVTDDEKKPSSGGGNGSAYDSVDPAPPTKHFKSVAELRTQLLDTKQSLYVRYKAMFALRNEGSADAVRALGAGCAQDKSPVFKHEVAYVMGQMQHEAAVPFLTALLADKKEHAMVRHEAAEALGSIGGDDVTKLLKAYQSADADIIVRESCDVALDIADYWEDDEQFDTTNQ